MIELLKSTDFEGLLETDKLVVVDFFASWCPPCKMLGPVVEEYAEKHPEVLVIKVNTDEYNSLAKKYDIFEVPTVLYFKNGELIHRHKGFMDIEQMEAYQETFCK